MTTQAIQHRTPFGNNVNIVAHNPLPTEELESPIKGSYLKYSNMNELHYLGITRKTTASNYIKAAVVQDWVNMIYPDIETLSIQYGLHAEVVADIIESVLLNSNIKNPVVITLSSRM